MSEINMRELIAEASGFDEFVQGGVEGLWRVEGDAVDILCVYTAERGTGRCSRFIDGLLKNRRLVRFLFVDNPILREALLRCGFIDAEWFNDGEIVRGMLWRAIIYLTHHLTLV